MRVVSRGPQRHRASPRAWEPGALARPDKSGLRPLALVLCRPCITVHHLCHTDELRGLHRHVTYAECFMGERTASYLYPGWKQTLRWHGSNPPAGRNGREKAREDLEGRLRASGFPLFVGRGSPSQLCPGRKMTEIGMEGSESYRNRTGGKSVTVTYEIVYTFSSLLSTSIHTFISPSRDRRSPSWHPTHPFSDKDQSLRCCPPCRWVPPQPLLLAPWPRTRPRGVSDRRPGKPLTRNGPPAPG